MDISPMEDLVRTLMGISIFFSLMFAIGLIIALIASGLAWWSYDEATYTNSTEARQVKFKDLRFARIMRMVALAALSVSLLGVAVSQTAIMQQRLIDSTTSPEPPFGSQVDSYQLDNGTTVWQYSDGSGLPQTPSVDLSYYNSGLPWLIIAWMAFAVVVVLLAVQLWAKPWRQYEDTPDGMVDQLNQIKWAQARDLKKLQKEHRKVLKQQFKLAEDHFDLLIEQSNLLDDYTSLIEESNDLQQQLAETERDNDELERKLDEARSETEEE
jgi:hypothetical protein